MYYANYVKTSVLYERHLYLMHNICMRAVLPYVYMKTEVSRTRGSVRTLFGLISTDQIAIRSAALAYYALFAFAPLILLVVVVSDVLLDAPTVHAMVFSVITEQVGPQIAPMLQQIEAHSTQISVNVISGIVGLLLVLYGATNFVMYLRSSFVDIFGLTIPAPEIKNTFIVLIKKYLRSFVYMLVLFVPILAAILVNSVIALFLPAFSASFQALFSSAYVSALVGTVMSVPLALVFFTVLYRIVSGGSISWRAAFWGACVSSGLLFILSAALQIYFIFSTTFVIYGAAGSVIVLLLWLYYAIQAMLIGAEVGKIKNV